MISSIVMSEITFTIEFEMKRRHRGPWSTPFQVCAITMRKYHEASFITIEGIVLTTACVN